MSKADATCCYQQMLSYHIGLYGFMVILNAVQFYESKYGCKDQESIQSSTTPDPGYQWENDTTNESQEVSPFPAGDYKAHINRRVQRHSKRKTEKT